MAYNKEQPKGSGKKLIALIYAVSDGISVDDADELIDFVTSLSAASDELKGDTDAAVAHFLAGAAEEFGDRRVDPTPPPTP